MVGGRWHELGFAGGNSQGITRVPGIVSCRRVVGVPACGSSRSAGGSRALWLLKSSLAHAARSRGRAAKGILSRPSRIRPIGRRALAGNGLRLRPRATDWTSFRPASGRARPVGHGRLPTAPGQPGLQVSKCGKQCVSLRCPPKDGCNCIMGRSLLPQKGVGGKISLRGSPPR